MLAVSDLMQELVLLSTQYNYCIITLLLTYFSLLLILLLLLLLLLTIAVFF